MTENQVAGKNFFRKVRIFLHLFYRGTQLRECLLWILFLGVFFTAEKFFWDHIQLLFDSDRAVWQWWLMVISVAFSLAYIVFLFVSALCFKSWHDVYAGNRLPGCTVIVPAYNEGSHVYCTIKSILQSDIPPEKLEIITVNDGSGDNTLHYQELAKACAPEIVKVIDLPQNMGKKHALYLGMKKATHDFIVTVDSDSLVRRDALRKILQPFADCRVGAVAGTIYGKKNNRNIHVRLLDVMLIFGCEFLRRAQSAAGNVFCTPGALSAYRKSAVMPLLDIWLNQSFMGIPAKIGEDRAIATLLLTRGYRVVHQPQARAETALPESYCGVCKMLLRWTRSDIRENILMVPAVFRGLCSPGIRSINLFLHWVMLFVNMLLPFIFLPLSVYLAATAPDIKFHLAFFCLSATLWSLIPAIVYVRERQSFRQTIWAFMYGFYSAFALSWIAVYSVLTVKNSGWLTRELKVSPRQ